MTPDLSAAAAPLDIGGVTLRNRLVATAHASGLVQGGLPVAGDAEYWGRLAAGGAAMLIGGGTVVAPESSPRRGNILEAWRPETVEPMRLRADAIHAEGGVAIVQLVHLGRETLGADGYSFPVAPGAVRSPREPTTPRALDEDGVAGIVEAFRVSSANVLEAGFDGIELHAAHAYLLEQFLSPRTNPRGDGVAVLGRVIAAIRGLSPAALLGIRFSVDASEDVALTPEELAEVLRAVDPLVDWVNVTVGVRTTYVRDMATDRPPLLDELARVRPLVTRPLIASQAFRDAGAIAEALAGGADLVGMARALIADPDLPRKVLSGRAAEVRPCVACNEDCRTFDPLLLCSVNPDLAPPGEPRRPGAPLVLRDGDAPVGRVAVVGAGPAGLECALSLARAGIEDVVLFEAADRIGGQLVVAAAAPHRTGWAPLLDFYAHGLATAGVDLRLGTPAADLNSFGAVVMAVGARETSSLAGAVLSSNAIVVRASAPSPETPSDLRSPGRVFPETATDARPVEGPVAAGHVVVVDDGFGWWPGVGAVELALEAGASVTFVTPGAAFAGGIPPESRVQLLKRLAGSLDILALTTAVEVTAAGVTVRRTGERTEVIAADRVVVVGERRSRETPACEAPLVLAIGDAIVPRRAAHAIAEGRAAAVRIAEVHARSTRYRTRLANR